MRTKYRIATDDECPTMMTHSQFGIITACMSEPELLPKDAILKEYGRVVFALLNGKIIVFAPEEEIPF